MDFLLSFLFLISAALLPGRCAFAAGFGGVAAGADTLQVGELVVVTVLYVIDFG